MPDPLSSNGSSSVGVPGSGQDTSAGELSSATESHMVPVPGASTFLSPPPAAADLRHIWEGESSYHTPLRSRRPDLLTTDMDLTEEVPKPNPNPNGTDMDPTECARASANGTTCVVFST